MDPTPIWVNSRLTREWWAFHNAHPEVGQLLLTLTMRLYDKGRRHAGIKMLWETLRYETLAGATPEEDAYRLNNNHHAYYARWLMDEWPFLVGMFSTRTSSAERQTA